MNLSTDGLKDKDTSSPALIHRGVLNWFSGWVDSAFRQGGREFPIHIDLDHPSYQASDYFPGACPSVPLPPNNR